MTRIARTVRIRHRLRALAATALVALAALAAPGAAQAERIYGIITGSNVLVSFDSANPSALGSTVNITGLASGQDVVAIDGRPATGQLYVLDTASRLYTLNPTTGVATQIPNQPVSPGLGQTTAAVGMDFNPAVDRLRLVDGDEQNLRVHPDTGQVTVDSALNYDPPVGASVIAAAAYTSNVPAAPSTTLFDFDHQTNNLVRQGDPGGSPMSPNTGRLTVIGPAGTNSSGGDRVGLDVSPSGTAFAMLLNGADTRSTLYTVNLTTGGFTPVGPIGPTSGTFIFDIAADVSDSDADRVADVIDNCPAAANADQRDLDSDGIGDVCDQTPFRPGDCANVFDGTDADDRITGTNAGDRLNGFGGDDRLDPFAGNDCADGGEDDDRILAAPGNDRYFGGRGNDRASGGDGNDRILGQDGRDNLDGGNGNDNVQGGNDKDKLSGGDGDDSLNGGNGNDTLRAGGGKNKLTAGAGRDNLNSRNGIRDSVKCGSGRDKVTADRIDRVRRDCERVRRR